MLCTVGAVRMLFNSCPVWFGLLAVLLAGSGMCKESATDATLAPVIVEDYLPPAFQTYPELSSGQVTVIERSDFQPDHHSVADVLENSPGVQIQSTGELGSFSAVSIRGATGQQSLIFIDGVPLAGNGGVVDLSQIPLNRIESIEIYRTAAPPQFGQDAMGGVVNIVTREKEAGSQAQLGVKAGSFGLKGLEGMRSWSVGRTHFNARGSALAAENDFPYLYDSGTPNVPEDDIDQSRNNAGYQRYSGALDIRRQMGIHQWQASVSGLWSDKQLPVWNNNPVQETYYRQYQVGASLAWSATGMKEGGFDQSLRYRSDYHSGRLHDPESVIGLNQNDSTDRYASHRLQHLGAFYWGDNITTAVNEVVRDDVAFEDNVQSSKYNYSEWSHVGSLSNEWIGVVGRLSLTTTARTLTTIGESSLIGGLVGLRYEHSDSWVLKANLSQTFRQPTLFERFGDQGYFLGNEDLVPEESLLAEASVEYHDDPMAVSVTLFDRIATNNIAPVYDSQGVGRYVNIGQVEFQGVEWAVEWRKGRLRLAHKGAYQPSLITSPVPSYDGRQAPGYYRLSHQTQANFRWGAWHGFTAFRYETGLFYDRANSTEAPERSELDIGLKKEWQWSRYTHQFEVKVVNLLDNRSMDMSRKPLPGRHFVAGYSINY